MKYSGVGSARASQCHRLLADAASAAAAEEIVVAVVVALLVRGHPRLPDLRVAAQPLDVLAPLVPRVLRSHTLICNENILMKWKLIMEN